MSDTTGNMFNSCARPISSVEGLVDETSSLNVFFCSDGRRSSSNNTISERRRRRRLNESLYSLRAIVPIITKDYLYHIRRKKPQFLHAFAQKRNITCALRKLAVYHPRKANQHPFCVPPSQCRYAYHPDMDKASIIEDAIDYIHQLQEQVKVAEEDVVRLKENITPPCERECSHVEYKGESMEELLEVSACFYLFAVNSIHMLDFDISEVKENVFSICLYCKGSPRLFVELDRVLESMEMLVTYANFNSFDGYILINIIVQKEDGEKLQVNVLKRVIAEVIK